MRHGRTLLSIIVALLVVVARPGASAQLPHAESFDGPDGATWPSPWITGSTHVTVHDLQGNRGRLNGDPAYVARMILPGFAESDVEVTVTFEFEDVANQGIGFYVRQNGGTLQEYLPHGQGYAMFLKGAWYWPEDLGLWREIDGVETQFAWGNNPISGGLQNHTRYRLRYRVTQTDALTTLLQAKVWPESSSEPAAWTIEASDGQAQLQGTLGSFAADIYNYSGFGHVFLDDLVIQRYPIAVGVGDRSVEAGLTLGRPRPHPVTGSANIDLVVPKASDARLRVYDSAGRLVAEPFTGSLGPGARTVSWVPIDRHGRRLEPGIYFLRLDSGRRSVTRRVVIGGY